MVTLYYATYREAIARARALAGGRGARVRIARGRDTRAPDEDFYAVTDGPCLPAGGHNLTLNLVAFVDVSGRVDMSGARYHRMCLRRGGAPEQLDPGCEEY